MDRYQAEVKVGEPVLAIGSCIHRGVIGAYVSPIPYTGPMKSDQWSTDYTTDSIINFGTKEVPDYEVIPDRSWIRIDPRSSQYSIFMTKYNHIRFRMHETVDIIHGCYAGRDGFINGVEEHDDEEVNMYTVRLMDPEADYSKPQTEVKLPGWVLGHHDCENSCPTEANDESIDTDNFFNMEKRVRGQIADLLEELAEELREGSDHI
ncbi:MAG: hypothetical protein NC131_09970 [Roseburia sp.]|nr:hypothetical protein [Roseburia sp.]